MLQRNRPERELEAARAEVKSWRSDEVVDATVVRAAMEDQPRESLRQVS